MMEINVQNRKIVKEKLIALGLDPVKIKIMLDFPKNIINDIKQFFRIGFETLCSEKDFVKAQLILTQIVFAIEINLSEMEMVSAFTGYGIQDLVDEDGMYIVNIFKNIRKNMKENNDIFAALKGYILDDKLEELFEEDK